MQHLDFLPLSGPTRNINRVDHSHYSWYEYGEHVRRTTLRQLYVIAGDSEVWLAFFGSRRSAPALSVFVFCHLTDSELWNKHDKYLLVVSAPMDWGTGSLPRSLRYEHCNRGVSIGPLLFYAVARNQDIPS
jgi:hypothetical protein